MTVFYIDGDLLDDNFSTIAHQLNCRTTIGKGLYSHIVKKYPHADLYSKRDRVSTPGTIYHRKNVIGMIAQYNPGKPNRSNDTKNMRLEWFEECLERIGDLGLEEIAFPLGIGCGLGGGHWPDYIALIEQFAIDNPHTRTYIITKD